MGSNVIVFIKIKKNKTKDINAYQERNPIILLWVVESLNKYEKECHKNLTKMS